MFIMRNKWCSYNLRLHHIINEYTDLILEITQYTTWPGGLRASRV